MPRVPRQVIVILVALTALYAAPSVISAQELRGSLLVEVHDSSGGAIPAAQITLADENSVTRLSQASDSRGEVHFPALSPSTYSLGVTAKGFAAQTQRKTRERFASRPNLKLRAHGTCLQVCQSVGG